MKKSLILVPLLLLQACGDRTRNYSGTVQVVDHYSQQELSGKQIEVNLCQGRGYSCDYLSTIVSDTEGKAQYHQEYEIKFGRGFEFQVQTSTDYEGSSLVRVSNDSLEVIKVKPLVPLYLTVDTAAAFDSICISANTNIGPDSHIIMLRQNDPLQTALRVVPEEANYIYLIGYNNGQQTESASYPRVLPPRNGGDSLRVFLPEK